MVAKRSKKVTYSARLLTDGKLIGERLEFPITLKRIDGLSSKTISVKTLDDLLDLITEEEEQLINKDKKISNILEDLGLHDTNTLADSRTINLINNFMYYKSSATPSAPFDNKIWFDTVLHLEPILNSQVL